MAKAKKDSADTQLALQVFENFQVDTIQANIPIVQQLKIDKKHPLYNQLQGKALKKDFQRQELSSILEKRRFRRPPKLSRAELQGKQGFLLDAQSIANAQRVLELCPEINFIPAKKPLNEVLSEESLKKLPEHLKKTSFEKNIIKDNSNNVYAISESALGKGAFGEVLIGQAIVCKEGTELKIGDFVAVKKQEISEDLPFEKVKQEFEFEKKVPNYHFGSALNGQNVYSFLRLIRGSELGSWIETDVAKKKFFDTKEVVLSQFEQDFMLSLLDPARYEIIRLTELQALQEISDLEKELDEFLEKIIPIKKEFESLQEKTRELTDRVIQDRGEKTDEEVNEEIQRIEQEQFGPISERLKELGWIDPTPESFEEGEIISILREKYDALEKKKLSQEHHKRFPEVALNAYPEYRDLWILEEKLKDVKFKLNDIISPARSIGSSLDSAFNPQGTFQNVVSDRETLFDPSSDAAKNEAKKESDTQPIQVNAINNTFPEEIELEKLLQVSLETAKKLQYIHQAGVLHRDLKPENILIETKTGEITIADFGISQMLGADKTVVSGVAGTARYWAPEIYNNFSATKILQSTATDMWSLGATFQNLVAPILEKIVAPEDLKHLMHEVREGPTEQDRMHHIIFNNPNNDPSIDALNHYFEVIMNLKKVDPANRKDIDYVIKELKEAIDKLRIETQRKNDLYHALSFNTSYNENSAHDLLEAKTAIKNWQKSNPKKPALDASENEIKLCVAQIIQKRKQAKEQAATTATHAKAQRDIFEDRAKKDYEHNKNVVEDLKEEIVYIASSLDRIPPEIQKLSESIDKLNEVSRQNREQVKELEKQIRDLKFKKVIKKDPSENEPSPEDKKALIDKLKEQAEQIGESEKINKKDLNELISRKAALQSELDRTPIMLANKEAHLLQVQKAIVRYENRDVPTPDEVADKKQDSTSSKRESPAEKRKEPIIKRQKIEKETSFASNDVSANERAAIPIKPHVPVTSSKPTKSPEQLALLSWFQNQDIQKLYSSQKVSKRIPFANLSIFQLDARKDQIKNLQNIVNNVAEMLNKDVHSPEALSTVMEGFLEEVRKMHQQVANEKNSRMLGDSKMEKMLENMKTELQDIVRDLGQLNQPKKDTPYSP